MAQQNLDAQRGGASLTSSDLPLKQYTWRIGNFSQLTDTKLTSPEFEIGTYTWRLVLLPRGTGGQDVGNYISLYLEYPEAPFTPVLICPKTYFEVTLVNQTNEEASVKKEANHVFTSQAKDWGFAQLLRLEDALKGDSGFVVNDTLVIRVGIDVQKRDHLNTLSRMQTGFTGLKNQGSTGYLNAVLQYLFHIPYLRKAVYQMPTLGMDETSRCVPLALQRLFYQLQYQNSSVSTRRLTESFGWGEEEVLLQHDVQEMLAMLRGNLEENMRGTAVGATIPDLFAGHYAHYIQCLEVDHTVVREQPFMDISLDVQNCKDIYESIEKFCADEKLDGQNKYRTEEFGLQDASRFTRFESFPPVLQLHLQRFDYDFVRNVMFKNNSVYKFYDELDLDYKDRSFLSETADKTVENKYRLHCVVTHTGGAAGGTYNIYIKSGDKWFRFEDELVTEVTAETAISEQFGGEATNTTATSSSGQMDPNKSTAYILVYVRISDWDRIMRDCGKDDMAEPIRVYFEAEQAEKEKRQKERQDAHLNVAIKLATEKHFSEQLAEQYYYDLKELDRVATYRLHKKTLFVDFKEKVSKDFGVPTKLQRFWLWKQRQNGTIHVDRPLDCSHASLQTVLDLRHFKEKTVTPAAEKNALLTIPLFLETLEAGNALHSLQANELLVFVKLYDPKTAKLSYAGHLFAEKSKPFSVMLGLAVSLAGMPAEADVVGFMVKHEHELVCADISPTETPEKSQLCQGDIIIIQERVTEEQQTQHDFAHPTARSFLESYRRVM